MSHYFLGIEIPDDLKNFYNDWQQELKPIFPYKSWTDTRDLHITLSFLGEVHRDHLEKLVKQLEILQFSGSFTLSLEGLGTFGKGNRPRVLFVDVRLNEELLQLQQQIVKATETLGFEQEKRAYRPHLTLGKKWGKAFDLPEGKLNEIKLRYQQINQFEVTAFTLYKIHPGHVPSYEKAAVFPL